MKSQRSISSGCLRRSLLTFFSIAFCFILSGCTVDFVDQAAVIAALTEKTETVQSVKTAITLYMEGQYYNLDKNGEIISTDTPHRASVDSKIDISSSFNPLAFYSESFSNITVDGFTTQEIRYGYTARSDSRYITYECLGNQEEWSKSFVSRPDELTLPKRTGLICDWEDFMSNLEYVETTDNGVGTMVAVYTGRISSTILQEIFADRVFDNFISNVEWVINETIPCTLYLSEDTHLPQSFELDLVNEFINQDVTFTDAKVTVSYSDWDTLEPITVPKKVSVLAEDHSAALYSTFATRDLFVPYEPKEGDVTTSETESTLPAASKTLPTWAQEAGLTTGESGNAEWYASVSVLKLKKSTDLAAPLILPDGLNLTLDLNGFSMTSAVKQPAIKTEEDAKVSLVVMGSGNNKNGILAGHKGVNAGESGCAAIDFSSANEASTIEITSAVWVTGGDGTDNGAGSGGNGGVAIVGGRSKVYIKPESSQYAPTVEGGDGGKYTGTDKTAGVHGKGGSAISTLIPTTKNSTVIFISGGMVRGGKSGVGAESPVISAPSSK